MVLPPLRRQLIQHTNDKTASMLLIYPPLAKNCEPPAGIAKIAGALRAENIKCTVLDANSEALHYLLQNPAQPSNTWSRRAVKNVKGNILALQDISTYKSFPKYKRAVSDLNRVLEITGNQENLNLSLANYQSQTLSPVKSKDLLHAASDYKNNIFYPYFKTRLQKLISDESPGLIGFSLNYLSQALCTFSLIGYLKQQYPEIPLVVGGGLVTSWMHNPTWKNPFCNLIDHLIDGPGEIPLLKLLRANKQPEKHHRPDFTDFSLHNYHSPGFILPYAASTGCYWNKCSFCPENAEKNPYTHIPEQSVAEDIEALQKISKPSLLHLLDNAISPNLMKQFIKKPPGMPWYGFARISPILTDLDFCKELRQSGCIMIKLGLESGDQNVLDSMEKGINLEMAANALKALKNAGIATYIYLLFGTPTETIKQARKTLDFTIQHHQAITFLNLAIFNMPICSHEVDHSKVKNFYAGDLSLYTDFIHPEGWNRKQVRKFLSQEFKKHPIVAQIINRDPPLFTSNHAPYFTNFPNR